jgi:Protein of unknown function (DUF1997)
MKTNGMKTNGMKTNGMKTNGPQSNGTQSNGTQSNGTQSNGMDTCFKAKQSVDIAIPAESIPVQPYLRQLERIVNALASSGTVTALEGDQFRLALRPLKFFTLTLQPIVDMRVWTTADDVLHVQSIACDILGLEQFNDAQFDLNLVGEMYPMPVRGKIHLQGQVALTVQVEMPMPISLTPKPVLEGTGNAIMLGVLSTMKQRLMKNLVADYSDWVRSQERSVLSAR